MMRRVLVTVVVVGVAWSTGRQPARAEQPAPIGASQAPAVPRPFPGTGPPRPADQPAVPAPQLDDAPPSPPPGGAPAGTPVYPTAEFIDSFDAGFGQRYYLYGTNIPYRDIVNYYKNLLRNNGRELYKTPPMQQFELGRFRNNSMAYPPSVVVKDYTSGGAPGYLAVSGTTEVRYATVIQIVPDTAAR